MAKPFDTDQGTGGPHMDDFEDPTGNPRLPGEMAARAVCRSYVKRDALVSAGWRAHLPAITADHEAWKSANDVRSREASKRNIREN